MKTDFKPLFSPKSVAVIGASTRPGSLGGAVVRNLLEGGFPGAIYPVHPEETAIKGIAVYQRVEELPETPELAVFAVASEAVLPALQTLLVRGTRAVIVQSAGYGELPGGGQDAEEQLSALCKEHEALLLGPNCLGLHVSTPDSRLDASFSRVRPEAGTIQVFSQSGSVAEWLMVEMHERCLGASLAVNPGNMAGLDLADLITGGTDWFPEARTLLVYLETLSDPSRLTQALARLSANTRVLLVPGTLAMQETLAAATSDNPRCSIHDSLEAGLDAAEAVSRLPVPAGTRVAVVTNAGGPGNLAAKALLEAGWSLPQPSASVCDALRTGVASTAILGNPVDLVSTASPGAFEHALKTLGNSGEVDALLAIFMHPVMTDGEAMKDALVRGLAAGLIPGVVSWLGTHDPVIALRGQDLVVIPEPSRAGRAVASLRTA